VISWNTGDGTPNLIALKKLYLLLNFVATLFINYPFNYDTSLFTLVKLKYLIMSTVLFLAIIIVIASASYLSVSKKEELKKRSSRRVQLDNELNNLYEYKYFLKGIKQAKMELHIKLTTITYYHLQNKIFFTPFEITVLKDDINGQIRDLEDKILNQAISSTDFNREILHLNKRIEVLSYPLAPALNY